MAFKNPTDNTAFNVMFMCCKVYVFLLQPSRIALVQRKRQKFLLKSNEPFVGFII